MNLVPSRTCSRVLLSLLAVSGIPPLTRRFRPPPTLSLASSSQSNTMVGSCGFHLGCGPLTQYSASICSWHATDLHPRRALCQSQICRAAAPAGAGPQEAFLPALLAPCARLIHPHQAFRHPLLCIAAALIPAMLPIQPLISAGLDDARPRDRNRVASRARHPPVYRRGQDRDASRARLG